MDFNIVKVYISVRSSQTKKEVIDAFALADTEKFKTKEALYTFIDATKTALFSQGLFLYHCLNIDKEICLFFGIDSNKSIYTNDNK